MRPVWGVLSGWSLAAVASLTWAQSPFGTPAIVGKIIWPDHDVSKAQVLLYRDAAMTELADVFPVGGERGTFVALVEPGEYYLMALVDANGSGKLDAGDAIGYFADLQTGAPKAIRLVPEGFVTDVHIAISATVGSDGKPEPLKDEAAKIETKPLGLPALVSGTLSATAGLTAPVFVILVNAENGHAVGVSRVPPDAQGLSLTAEKGVYHVLAVTDSTGDGKIGPGDLVGVYGVSDWSAPPDRMPQLTLGDGDEIAGIEISMTGIVAEDGTARGGGTTEGLKLPALPAVLSGTVRPSKEQFGAIQVRISSDPGMREQAAVATASADGTFIACVPPGTYFLTAICDANPDGAFGPGDLVGFYGVPDLISGAPKPLTVSSGSLVLDIPIVLIGRVTDDRGVAPISQLSEGKTEG